NANWLSRAVKNPGTVAAPNAKKRTIAKPAKPCTATNACEESLLLRAPHPPRFLRSVGMRFLFGSAAARRRFSTMLGPCAALARTCLRLRQQIVGGDVFYRPVVCGNVRTKIHN